MLTVRHLVKEFYGENKQKICAVNRLCFSVQAGEVYSLLGPNGAGKTTTLRILATLAHADSGEIHIDGIDRMRQPLEIRKRLAYVPAEAGLPERLSPTEVVTLFARIQGIPQPQKRAASLLEQLGARSFASKPCGELSTGMRRRVVLARALVHDPKLLLLDEPTDGLDVSGRRDVLELVRAQANAGCAVVLSSHIMGEVQQVSDRIGILHRGALVCEGTLTDIIAATDYDNLNDAFLALTSNIT